MSDFFGETRKNANENYDFAILHHQFFSYQDMEQNKVKSLLKQLRGGHDEYLMLKKSLNDKNINKSIFPRKLICIKRDTVIIFTIKLKI